MGTSEVRRGRVAERVRDNIKRIRQSRKMTGARLAELLGALGRPMQPTAVNKIETGARRVDVDDLVAIAMALNTTPNRLLLDDPAGRGADIELAPRVTAMSDQAWTWANGRQVLLPSGKVLDWGNATFGQVQQEFLRHARPPAQHPAEEAADDFRGRVGAFLSWVHEYRKEKAEAEQAGDGDIEIPLDHLMFTAEMLRQSLKRLEEHVAQLISDSPLADQAEYGQAFIASAEVHHQTVARVDSAREHVHMAREAYAMQEQDVFEVKKSHAALRESLTAAAESGDAEAAAQLAKADAEAAAKVEQAMEAQIEAYKMEGLANEALQRAQRELYELRRMMLIRNMVPPQLPPALAYIDNLHPTDNHADQLRELWSRISKIRALEFAIASESPTRRTDVRDH